MENRNEQTYQLYVYRQHDDNMTMNHFHRDVELTK